MDTVTDTAVGAVRPHSSNSISPSLIEELSQPNAFRSWLAIIQEWMIIFLCFWLVIRFPNPFVWVGCFILIGRQNYALMALMHEACHGHLFRSKKMNDFVCHWICAGPATFHNISFRRGHARHHAAPLRKEIDPDYRMTSGYPLGKKSYLRKTMRDLLGVTNFVGRIKPAFVVAFSSRQRFLEEARNCFSIFFSMFVIWGGFYLAGHPWHFVFFWLLPPATVGVVLCRLGFIVQHGGLVADHDQTRSSRSMKSGWQNFWVVPYNGNYHVEHHLFPTVPFFNLPVLHEKLAERNALPSNNSEVAYGMLLKKLIR